MNEFTFGALAGVSAGVASAALVGALVRRIHTHTTDPVDEVTLSSYDHVVIAGDFQTHAEAMKRQVSEYADALAGGDLVLREQLRRIEGRQS